MIHDIYNKYGLEAMREIWIEELLELATRLQQSKRHHFDESLIIDEIADVSFCIDQMFELFGYDKCKAQKEFKMQRTKQRLL